jgi:hypothetical protein
MTIFKYIKFRILIKMDVQFVALNHEENNVHYVLVDEDDVYIISSHKSFEAFFNFTDTGIWK